MKNFKFITPIIIICFVLLGCSSDSEEPEEINTYDDIVGKWTTTSYFSSGGYFVENNDGEFFDFKSDKTCVYFGGDALNTYDYYEYGYSPSSKTIGLKHAKGWDLNIKVEFSNENEAIFYIDGKTSNSSKTIKVKRN